MSEVKIVWDKSGLQSLFLSPEIEAAVKAEAEKLAPQADANIRKHLHAPMNMGLVDVRTKKLKSTWVGIVQAKSFKKGAKRGGTGPLAAAKKYGIK